MSSTEPQQFNTPPATAYGKPNIQKPGILQHSGMTARGLTSMHKGATNDSFKKLLCLYIYYPIICFKPGKNGALSKEAERVGGSLGWDGYRTSTSRNSAPHSAHAEIKVKHNCTHSKHKQCGDTEVGVRSYMTATYQNRIDKGIILNLMYMYSPTFTCIQLSSATKNDSTILNRKQPRYGLRQNKLIRRTDLCTCRAWCLL